ncbi:hypothetical protein K461DRAFT_316500 [Myriangium duriaei CBS 260.36]|uniref:Uncharacterized protein n=1 Tax=Myriangium duriaei CBS 260.36 TaxID=1168546 RepID=A0A9P4ISY3_9PEZI|nr:hypothetical protein K461DRAFT_316500 [Myriangium duriaei CBS 260.36]
MVVLYAAFLLACFCNVQAATTIPKTSQFWGYGIGIHGLPLFAAGTSTSTTWGAYIGNGTPQESTSATNITLTLQTSNHTMQANPTGSNTTAPTPNWSLYIINGTNADEQAGFADAQNNNGSLTFTGWAIWGQFLVWVDSDGSYTSKWSAEPTDTEGIYEVRWNSADATSDTAVPIVFKNKGPKTGYY